MDAFELLVSMLLRHEGYWTTPSYKVELTADDKRKIGRLRSPPWELDLVAYKGQTNELLMVECKSFLDSEGVLFRKGRFKEPKRYKLFSDNVLFEVVQNRLRQQLAESGACASAPTITLCLAVGNLSSRTDAAGMKSHFDVHGWRLFDPDWVRERLITASKAGYENDVAFVVSKLLLRNKQGSEDNASNDSV